MYRFKPVGVAWSPARVSHFRPDAIIFLPWPFPRAAAGFLCAVCFNNRPPVSTKLCPPCYAKAPVTSNKSFTSVVFFGNCYEPCSLARLFPVAPDISSFGSFDLPSNSDRASGSINFCLEKYVQDEYRAITWRVIFGFLKGLSRVQLYSPNARVYVRWSRVSI